MDVGDILKFLAIALAAFGALFGCLSLGLTNWQSTEQISEGLWRYCVKDDKCTTYGSVGTELKAVRAVLFLGLFCMIGSTVAVILHVFVRKNDATIYNLSLGLSICAGLLFMIGFAVYANKLKVDGTKYGAGFAMAVLSWLISWVIASILGGLKFTRQHESV